MQLLNQPSFKPLMYTNFPKKAEKKEGDKRQHENKQE